MYTKSHTNRTGYCCYAQSEINRLISNNQFTTARNYRTVFNSFLCFRKYKDVEIKFINNTLIEDYQIWLKQRDLCLNTISCYMRVLRAVYNKACREICAVEHRNPFTTVFKGKEDTKKRSITEEKMRTIIGLDLTKRRAMCLARDIFVFSFFTRGMPFVDIAYLKKKDIKGDYLSYKRHKTNQTLNVKLEPCIKQLIDKYHDVKSEYIFPIIKGKTELERHRSYRTRLCYQNRCLKYLSELPEINCKLTSYVSRHTWASLAWSNNIALHTISEALGHRNAQTTLTYIRSLEERVIDKANRKLLKQVLKFNYS